MKKTIKYKDDGSIDWLTVFNFISEDIGRPSIDRITLNIARKIMHTHTPSAKEKTDCAPFVKSNQFNLQLQKKKKTQQRKIHHLPGD